MTAKEHYDTHLGNVYSWMLGDFSEKVSEQLHFFQKYEIQPFGNHVALDLGAGNGIQSVALARLGFKVKAVDFNKQLLRELIHNKGDLPVDVIENDILDFLDNNASEAELIVCMGDTLTHLQSIDDVGRMAMKIAERLKKGGKVVISFRDLSQERFGCDRFFQVRSDDSRSMVCFLEYRQDRVLVHDLILEKTSHGWTQRVSSYPKLRISVDALKEIFRKNEIAFLHEDLIRGMTFLVGSKS